MGWSGLWSISWLHHQMFYPYIKTSTSCNVAIFFLSFFLSFFLTFFFFSFWGTQRILGYVRVTKDSSGASSKKKEKKAAFRGVFVLWQPLRSFVTQLFFKCSSEGCRPLTETQHMSQNDFHFHNMAPFIYISQWSGCTRPKRNMRVNVFFIHFYFQKLNRTQTGMLNPTEDYNTEHFNFLFVYFFLFTAKSWRIKISGYKLRYNRAAGGKKHKLKTVNQFAHLDDC